MHRASNRGGRMLIEDESGAFYLYNDVWYVVDEFGDLAEAITIH